MDALTYLHELKILAKAIEENGTVVLASASEGAALARGLGYGTWATISPVEQQPIGELFIGEDGSFAVVIFKSALERKLQQFPPEG